jgi:thiol-disulfide isomerase/thioredoxin
MNKYSKHTVPALIAVILLGTISALATFHRSSKKLDTDMLFQARTRAPELTGGAGWLNTDKPITIAGLRGKVVLLDFWTYCCINCMHVIPDLKKLEHKYSKELVVIGVHSAKFKTEKESENIQQAILRYGLEHPVVNDNQFKIWQAYAVNSWPTLVLIDTDGYIVGQLSGEGVYDVLDENIAKLVDKARADGKLNETPLNLALERAKFADTPLLYPGKVLADTASNRLFISDSNHNRIVISSLDGKLIDTIGSGAIGQSDGDYAQALFNHPQGMALDGDTLYLADTENHLLRRINLKERKVETIAGTGEQARRILREGGDARTTALNSPWDLNLLNGKLYIAMAGPHQVWVMDLAKNTIGLYAGSPYGQEARVDGKLQESAFAQPSGITSDGKHLYTADSEISSIRSIDLSPDGSVRTLVGGDLFEFGDIDGVGDSVRLQHPLGVTYNNGSLFVADTYNHKIKKININDRRSESFLGTGKPGLKDGKSPEFYEPGGLSIANGKLYVADTDNHSIRVVDLKSKETTTLTIAGLKAVSPPKVTTEFFPNLTTIEADPQKIAAGKAGELILDVKLPAGYHLNSETPHKYKLEFKSGADLIAIKEGAATLTAKDLKLPVHIPYVAKGAGKAELNAVLTVYYCRDDNQGACKIKSLNWHVPVEVVAAGGSSAVTVSYVLK